MAEARPPLAPSLSFPGTCTVTPASRPLKRHFTSTEDFFVPAADSFKPRPYTPNNAPTSQSRLRQPPRFRDQQRSIESLAIPPTEMDPSPKDPRVLFVHPPFNSFPNAHLHASGLTYALMAENPEWFLDPNDYIALDSTNSDAVPYPPNLEPPRGWCPAKKKDLKDRGPEGWPEGEEPRLRCTFCRRTYAGVNAKSMWRRHVFEKHKIAMSNRRDTAERPRGRGTASEPLEFASATRPLLTSSARTEENRIPAARPREDFHESLVSMDVAPQTDSRGVSHKSRFRTMLSSDESRRRRTRGADESAPAAPRIPQGEFSVMSDDETYPADATVAPPTPPRTPKGFFSSDPASSSDDADTTSPLTLPIIPQSPYDPSATPSFRHSPPRLPSDQPWLFPSPTHPFSLRRNLSLGMLLGGFSSPSTCGSPAPQNKGIDASPMTSLIRELATPSSLTRLPRPSPQLLFSGGRFLGPDHSVGKGPRGHRKMLSVSSEDWFSEEALVSATTSPLGNVGLLSDPFTAIYEHLKPVNVDGEGAHESAHLSISHTDPESPVLRSGPLPTGVGLGIGLLKPFTLGDDDDEGIPFDETYLSLGEDELEEAEIAGALRSEPPVDAPLQATPPHKRRRTSLVTHSSVYQSSNI